MTIGIIKEGKGFSLMEFESGNIMDITVNGNPGTYLEAVEACNGVYEESFYPYLVQAATLEKVPDADVWENMIYAKDPRGIWDGEKEEYRNVTSMDRGAATDEEIDYVDALDATYHSLMAMVGEE